jgi:hypothetical protein
MQPLADALRSAHGTSDRVVSLPPDGSPIAGLARAREFIRTFEGLEPSFSQSMREVEFTAQNASGRVPFLLTEVKPGRRSSS